MSGDSSSDASDIWDDTLLVEAYDKAVNIAKTNCLKKQSTAQEQGKQNKRKESDNQKWKVGDKCRCQYSEDLHYYEADIIGITESSGTCIVEYVGYKNKEKVFLKNLKPSKGEDARLQQIEDAENDVGNNVSFNCYFLGLEILGFEKF